MCHNELRKTRSLFYGRADYAMARRYPSRHGSLEYESALLVERRPSLRAEWCRGRSGFLRIKAGSRPSDRISSTVRGTVRCEGGCARRLHGRERAASAAMTASIKDWPLTVPLLILADKTAVCADPAPGRRGKRKGISTAATTSRMYVRE
jgi:hypothetical protein